LGEHPIQSVTAKMDPGDIVPKTSPIDYLPIKLNKLGGNPTQNSDFLNRGDELFVKRTICVGLWEGLLSRITTARSVKRRDLRIESSTYRQELVDIFLLRFARESLEPWRLKAAN
jgi:hypothetical protein